MYFSRLTPTLTMVIPAMDHIDETLTSQSLDSDYEPAIRAVLGLAKRVLNHYYSATDHSECIISQWVSNLSTVLQHI